MRLRGGILREQTGVRTRSEGCTESSESPGERPLWVAGRHRQGFPRRSGILTEKERLDQEFPTRFNNMWECFREKKYLVASQLSSVRGTL